MLNMASCYLRLGDNAKCVSVCSDVLNVSPDNVKALYRRGQAQLALNNKKAAISDLKKAFDRCVVQPFPFWQWLSRLLIRFCRKPYPCCNWLQGAGARAPPYKAEAR
jgi:tetratricopeptide (TPR) repeat protein